MRFKTVRLTTIRNKPKIKQYLLEVGLKCYKRTSNAMKYYMRLIYDLNDIRARSQGDYNVIGV